ncbi:MAG: UDP-N-acetylmuramate--L-alanine ligase [Syntrophomonadaceae bacterium]|jgi:UDP-N-acetylmuramate--alanine ligase
MITMPHQWIHMVGIAGAGMSGIAQVLVEKGFKVSGSDLQVNSITKRLEEIGIKIYKGHSSSNLKEGVDLLVVSSAIPHDNIEVKRAEELNIPVLKRGQMLARLVNPCKGIAIAGAHGKTTTTSMIYMVLNQCGLEPAFIVGGQLQGSNLGATNGKGDYFVVEADESDASFLGLKPYVAVVTNVEDDHLDYYKSVANIENAFQHFINGVKPEGFAVLYGEDSFVQKVRESSSTRTILYGENKSNDFYIENWKPKGIGSQFEVYKKNQFIARIELSIPGKHNALNALAAICVALELDLNIKLVKKALKRFGGAKRRFEIIGQVKNVTVVDDYAHHPTEIRATINAAKQYHKGRVIVVFQPHRYSRTQNLGDQLGEALSGVDLAIITDIYSAGEKIIPEVSGEKVYKASLRSGTESIYISGLHNVEEFLFNHYRSGDLIITMGAGDIWKVGTNLVRKLSELALQA